MLAEQGKREPLFTRRKKTRNTNSINENALLIHHRQLFNSAEIHSTTFANKSAALFSSL